MGVAFKYPKHHSLRHLVDIIRRKGAINNYSTDRGEAQHPQTKKDYTRTSKQPGVETEQVFYLNYHFEIYF